MNNRGETASDRWRAVMDLFDAAAELPAGQRRAFLESSTSSPDVVKEVLELLAKLEASGDASPAPAHQAPERIGRYKIVGRLGRGGMGQVYTALDTELGRFVAMKLLAPEVVATKPAMDRLIREAKAASALNHPHIVTVYEVVRSGDEVALAMELVEGEALRSYCRQTQPVGQVIRWGRQAAQALAAAHARNIVHHDIKPENLMVRSDGYVKVLDFGLARQLTSGSQRQIANSSVRLAGTLSYMAPEQTRGEAATTASDVFSLGIVLFELATGTHPFRSDSPLDTAHAIAHADPKSPNALNHEISAALNSLLLAMLAKRAGERPSAAEVDRTLAELERAPSPTTLTPTKPAGSAEFPAFGNSAAFPSIPEQRPQSLKKHETLRYRLVVGLVACLAGVFALWLTWGRIFAPPEPVMTQLTAQGRREPSHRRCHISGRKEPRLLGTGRPYCPAEDERWFHGTCHDAYRTQCGPDRVVRGWLAPPGERISCRPAQRGVGDTHTRGEPAAGNDAEPGCRPIAGWHAHRIHQP